MLGWNLCFLNGHPWLYWERESSEQATLRRVFLWGWHLPLWIATWISDVLKPLLLSISMCSLRSTRRMPYHVRVPVLWTWSCCRTQSPRCQQPSPCWRRPVGPVTHTATHVKWKSFYTVLPTLSWLGTFLLTFSVLWNGVQIVDVSITIHPHKNSTSSLD